MLAEIGWNNWAISKVMQRRCCFDMDRCAIGYNWSIISKVLLMKTLCGDFLMLITKLDWQLIHSGTISRKLTDTESNYSNIEREVLTVV